MKIKIDLHKFSANWNLSSGIIKLWLRGCNDILSKFLMFTVNKWLRQCLPHLTALNSVLSQLANISIKLCNAQRRSRRRVATTTGGSGYYGVLQACIGRPTWTPAQIRQGGRLEPFWPPPTDIIPGSRYRGSLFNYLIRLKPQNEIGFLRTWDHSGLFLS